MQHTTAPNEVSTTRGWSNEETQQLLSAMQERGDRPLKQVFEAIAARTGRKPNSVRNHYYQHMKTTDEQVPPAFVPFTEEETATLLEAVAQGRAQGLSVRACVQRLAQGDTRKMLRYQNKYRSLAKQQPAQLQNAIRELEPKGSAELEMIKGGQKKGRTRDNPPAQEVEQAAAIPSADILLEALNQHSPQLAPLKNIMEGLALLVMQASSRAASVKRLEQYDRMQVRYDLARIKLDQLTESLAGLQQHCMPLLDAIRMHLALPADKQAAANQAFLTELCQRIGGVEGALCCADRAMD